MNVNENQLHDVTLELLKRAGTQMPKSVGNHLLDAFKRETNLGAKGTLASIIENLAAARECQASICQDMGVPTFSLKIGSGVKFDCDPHKVVTEAVREATATIPLRKNVIEPFTQKNLKDNTGWGAPLIHYDYDPDLAGMKMRVELKGFGGEIKSQVDWVFTSTRSMEDAVVAIVLNSVLISKGEACTPSFLGVGVGGYGGDALSAAKGAIFRSILPDGRNKDPFLSKLETRLFEAVNRTCVGPMGSGGDTTTLAVFVERMGTHTAVSPVAVAHQCWASRGSEAIIHDGQVEYLTEHVDAAFCKELRSEVKRQLSTDSSGRIHRIKLPASTEQIKKFRVGDLVYLDGKICTSRDGAHRRMVQMVQQGRRAEIPADMANSKVVYHCGPVTEQVGEEWRVSSAGPTTSSRFTADAAVLMAEGVANLFIGKGTMGPAVINAMKGRGAYLQAVGGCAVSYQKTIKTVGVNWLDLGPPEAMWVFDVENFGPLVVGIDPEGNSLSKNVMEVAYQNALNYYEERGMDPNTRYAQRPVSIAGLSLNEVIDFCRKN